MPITVRVHVQTHGVRCLKNYTINTQRKHQVYSQMRRRSELMYERPDTNKDGEGKQSGNPRRALRGREGVRTRRRSVRKDELQASHVDRSAKAEPSSPGRRRQRAQEGDARAAITGRIGVSDHPREHKQNFIARMANQWFDRVMGAMRGDGPVSYTHLRAHETF